MSFVFENKKAIIMNLGCKVNKYESDAMAEKLKKAGMRIVEPDEMADFCIVNTCSVTNMAEKKSRQMLRRVKKQNPDAVIVAVGCYVNAKHDELLKEEFIDVLVGNNCKKDIVEVLADYVKNQNMAESYCDINQTKEYEEIVNLEADTLDHQRAYIKIQDGCNQFCSYCLIPYTRGRIRSREPENIINEITNLAMQGIKEFVLTGIHISSYGVDFDNGIGLGELICAINEIPQVRRIRLGSLEPRIITEEFLEMIVRCEKLCPHFHLSLQSACNETLKRMNRKYTIEEYERKCQMLRDSFVNPAITTDVIVGFPGETEEEFETTVLNLTRLNLYEIHVFKYSVRSGTVAEKMPNHVPENVKAMRSDILLDLTAKQKEEFEQLLMQSEDEVLVEEIIDEKDISGLKKAEWLDNEEKNCYVTGHTKRYVRVVISANEGILNQIIKVKLV